MIGQFRNDLENYSKILIKVRSIGLTTTDEKIKTFVNGILKLVNYPTNMLIERYEWTDPQYEVNFPQFDTFYLLDNLVEVNHEEAKKYKLITADYFFADELEDIGKDLDVNLKDEYAEGVEIEFNIDEDYDFYPTIFPGEYTVRVESGLANPELDYALSVTSKKDIYVENYMHHGFLLYLTHISAL